MDERPADAHRTPRFAALATVIVLLSFAVRAYRLDLRPYHHDEAIHGYDSYQIAKALRGNEPIGYAYNPTYHGPLLYYLTAATFALAGDSDASGRGVTVFFGVLLIACVLAFARELGRGAALSAAVLLAVSPFQIYFSRFLRHDALMLVATVIFYGLFYRGAREGRGAAKLCAVAVLALAFSTMENAYIVALVFAASLLFMGASKVLCRSGGLRSLLRTRGAGRLRLLFGHAGDLACEHQGIVQGMIVLLGFASFNLLGALLSDFEPLTRALCAGLLVLSLSLVALPLLFMAMSRSPEPELRALWRALRGPALGVLVFAPIFAFVYTNAFVHPERLGTGLFGALSYWSGQQAKPRLDGPFLYYVPLMCLHEPVTFLTPILFAFTRAGRLLRRLILLFLYVAAAAFLVGSHSYLTALMNDLARRVAAGHGPLDLAFAAALALLFLRESHRELHRGDVPLAFTWLWALFAFLIYAWAREKVPWLGVHLVLPFALLTALLLRRARPMARAGVLALAVGLAAHSRYLVVKGKECNIADPIVYVQTLPHLPAVVMRVEKSRPSGMPLLLQSDVTVPFYWYFRHAPVLYPETIQVVRPGQPVLAASGHEGKAAEAPGLSRKRLHYYGWMVHDWADTGMGIEGIGALLDWLPRYLIEREATPFRQGTYDATVFLPSGDAPVSAPARSSPTPRAP